MVCVTVHTAVLRESCLRLLHRLSHADAADGGDDDEANPFVMLSKATEQELPGVLSEVPTPTPAQCRLC